MANKAYTVTEYRQATVTSNTEVIEHRFNSAKEMIENADRLADIDTEEMESGKIAWFLIQY